MISFFCSYDSDTDEEYDANVENSFTVRVKPDTSKEYTPKNGCGRRADMLKNSKVVSVRLQLFSCLSSMSAFIPNGVPIGLKLYLTSSKLFFVYPFQPSILVIYPLV